MPLEGGQEWGQAWCHNPVIPELGKWGQDQELKASIGAKQVQGVCATGSRNNKSKRKKELEQENMYTVNSKLC